MNKEEMNNIPTNETGKPTMADMVASYKDEQEKQPKEKPRKKKKRVISRTWFKVSVSIVVLLGIIFVMGFGYLNNLSLRTPSRNTDKFANKVNAAKGLDVSAYFDSNTINVLFFGLDKNEAREETYDVFRPDTIILASINLETNTISLVSIPRDTYVPLYGYLGKAKINSCMYYGTVYGDSEDDFVNGVDCLSQTVSALFGGLPIDYYVGIDMTAVVEIVDALGGVEIDVPYDIWYPGSYQEPYIHAGQQTLNGAKLLYLARDRDYAGDDIYRTEMQREIIKAVFTQFKQSNKLTSIPKIYNSVMEHVSTDMNFEQIVSLSLALIDVSSSDISTHVFPGTYGSRDGVSMWIVDQYERVALIQELYGITATAWAQDATVIDTRVPADTDTSTDDDTDDGTPPTDLDSVTDETDQQQDDLSDET